MPLDREADYVSYLYTCNKCRSCAVTPSPDMRPLCPANARFGYFTYSGGGKGYVAQGIIEGVVEASPEAAHVAMNCLLCGACAHVCPPGFDIMAYIRDLRDHLVGKGIYINDAHRDMIEKTRSGDLWGPSKIHGSVPRFTGSEELLVFMGCAERARGDVIGHVGRVLDKAGVSWGVLDDEPCCGAPLEDLGDMAGFEEAAVKNMDVLNNNGAARVVALCPHCAATMINDYVNVDDLEVDVVTLPSLIAELLSDERIELKSGGAETVTFHDPCRLGRFLEETEPPREIIGADDDVDLIEMERSGELGWCCGSGAWAAKIVPELAEYAAMERVAEAMATGAESILTACSYCTGFLRKISGGKPKVKHLAEFVAEKLK